MLKVYLSPIAEKKLSLLLDFVELEWSKKERKELLEKIEDEIAKFFKKGSL